MADSKTAPVSDVTASSFYKSDAFGPANLIDGGKDFGGWITDAGKCGGAWVAFRFAEPVLLGSVEICNGFIEEEAAKTRDDYYFHKRAREITISFGAAGPSSIEATLEDSKEPQTIPLNPAAPVTEARISIRSVYDASPGGTIKPFDVLGLRQVTWLMR
ncbi:MAG: hypothetical protein RIB59_16615 [Rhodospirillales bacterium]